jgi:hypothetical protein
MHSLRLGFVFPVQGAVLMVQPAAAEIERPCFFWLLVVVLTRKLRAGLVTGHHLTLTMALHKSDIYIYQQMTWKSGMAYIFIHLCIYIYINIYYMCIHILR